MLLQKAEENKDYIKKKDFGIIMLKARRGGTMIGKSIIHTMNMHKKS